MLKTEPIPGHRIEGGSRGPRLARSMAQVHAAPLRELLVRAAQPGVLSLAVGMPGTDLFPAAELAHAGLTTCADDPEALQYGMPSARLKSHIVTLMAWRGVSCREEQIFLTAGAQQGMDLLARLLLDPGGTLVLERTVFEGMALAVRPFSPQILTVPTCSEEGLDVDALEDLLAAGPRPAFLYVIPEGHNPLGVSLSRQKRQRLVELAQRYEMPILEDDAYGLLTYDGPAEAPLRALDDQWVFYLGSFSKILSPALRVGWIVLPEELVPRLSSLKHGSDLDVATLSQRQLASYLDAGAFPGHLETVRQVYRRRRDAMLEALSRHFSREAEGRVAHPSVARWSRPSSSIYIWLEMAPEIDAAVLLGEAIEHEKVAFCPGQAFAAGGGRHADHCLRLTFADTSPERIDEGISRLARAVHRSLPALSLAS